LRDTNSILLAGEEATYDFIRKLVRAASRPFRTRRIHVGMDEAHGVGTGQYLKKHGVRRPFDIMNEHIARVKALCEDEGLRPMIWSDMYFRLGSKTGSYYDPNWRISAHDLRKVPRGVDLVYWDYYRFDSRFYRQMIVNHRKLGSEPLMAGGIWTWNIQWAALRASFTAVAACMEACRAEGLKEVFMTMWGDDGNECDQFSALPGIQQFCELAFDPQATMDDVARRFRAVCGCDMAPWVHASDINTVPLVKVPERSHTNTAKILTWQDPLLALVDAHIAERMNLAPHYRALADELAAAAKEGGLANRLTYPALIANLLAWKVNLRQNLAAAYRAGDRRAMRKLVDTDLRQTHAALEKLWKHHRALWMATNAPYGWEVIEHRYGGLLARLATVRERLEAWIAGKPGDIPELREKILNPWSNVTDTVSPAGYMRLKTPSTIR
jgi:hypothetical protein